MNRAELRRNEREAKKQNVSYKLTNAQIEQLIDDRARDLAVKSLINFSKAFALALHDEYEFGEKRLNKVITKAFSYIECVGTGNLDLDSLNDWANSIGLNQLENIGGKRR
jgi:hypothetical protein